MSFIIQGVDLPKGYKALHMRVQSDGVVRYLIEGDDPVHIIDGARAIQIPKDHGRLIDGDKLNKSVHEWNPAYAYGRSAFTREIRNAPTILGKEAQG